MRNERVQSDVLQSPTVLSLSNLPRQHAAAFDSQDLLQRLRHLCFHDGVVLGLSSLGAEPYLSEAQFRAHLKSGRITDADLAACLRSVYGSAGPRLGGFLDAEEVRMTMLRHAVHSDGPDAYAWLAQERELKRRLRKDVGDWQRERLLVGTLTWLRSLLSAGDEAAALRFGAAVTGKLERAEVQRELARNFGVELAPGPLTDALTSRPEAYAVTALWQACKHVVRGVDGGDTGPAAGQRGPSEQSEGLAAYQLFQLMQLSGFAAPTVRELDEQAALDMLAVVQDFSGLSRRRIFQQAFERRYYRKTLDSLWAQREVRARTAAGRTSTQYICSCDPREEPFRRHIEDIEPTAQTFGAMLEGQRGADWQAAAAGAPSRGDEDALGQVATMLENIGLTRGFARLVVLLGLDRPGRPSDSQPHGAESARRFARLANDPQLRQQLRTRGIAIPEDTYFVGGHHNHVGGSITLFDLERLPGSHQAELFVAKRSINEARARTARECAGQHAVTPLRSHVAGAAAAPGARTATGTSYTGHAVTIVGRRELSRGLSLDARASVVSYDPVGDPDARILEQLLLATVPQSVASSLKDYVSCMKAASSLPRDTFGAHEPMRLLVLVEATPTRLLGVTRRSTTLSALLVNCWLRLVSIHPDTGAMQVYSADGFEPYTPEPIARPDALAGDSAYRGRRDRLLATTPATRSNRALRYAPLRLESRVR